MCGVSKGIGGHAGSAKPAFEACHALLSTPGAVSASRVISENSLPHLTRMLLRKHARKVADFRHDVLTGYRNEGTQPEAAT